MPYDSLNLKAVEPNKTDPHWGPHASSEWGRSESVLNFHTPHDPSQQALNSPADSAAEYREVKLQSAYGLLPNSTYSPVKSQQPLSKTVGSGRRKKWTIIAAVTTVIIVVGVGLGVGLGIGLGKPHSVSRASSKGKGLDPSGNDPHKIKPLPFWDWADKSRKAMGVSLGNWLVLERWMDEDWFTKYAPDAFDEWHFVQTVGENASHVLDEHYDQWVTEDEIEIMYQHGMNQIRIPVGFWSFIPVNDTEPYVNCTQLFHLTRMLGWLWKREMYAVIDMHGMPGSQSGDQSTGQNTTSPSWWTEDNQNRSDQTIDALLDWLSYNPYKSVVSAISPVNEPNGVWFSTQGNNVNVTAGFYERSYSTLQKAGYSMFFHHGFVHNPSEYWEPFATGKNASMLVINDNPYPGWFPAVSNETKINTRVCETVTSYNGFPVPMAKTEYSLISGINGTDWQKQYFSTQTNAYAASAGSFFWNFKMENATTPVTALSNESQMQYSFLQAITMGAVPSKSSNQTSADWLKALPSPACGSLADTYSPVSSSPALTSAGHLRQAKRHAARAHML